MELRIIIGKWQKPYVEIEAELDYSLSADEAADVLRQAWNKKIIPLQTGLDAADAERKEFEEKLITRIIK
ncbi:hypothetical protein [Cloacibacillus porcorum]|uniref:Uncharacterized protein n=1 Tax=Cloacibacillus porcorum TaxID=1197717 RepID=A0A1B2I685_9BACT|nr:hypothetical protein [Cloacibacillus porcorum]ANZ45480.1 hypothetical protein BED41_10615 [Cloacibacillus porcorum]